jgi:phosphate transport system permease protein
MDVMEAPRPAADVVAPDLTLRLTLRSPARRHYADAVYRGVATLVALSMVVVLAGIVAVLLHTAWPTFGSVGFSFFTGTVWNQYTNAYGALPFLVGTLITTALALLVAVPVSLAISVLLTEYMPGWMSAVLCVIIDVAAGVPTIVFGAWALLALVPWLHYTGEPALQVVLGWLPIFSTPPIGYITGEGMLATGLVLAAMVFPTIVSVTRNAFRATPQDLRESSLALGATTWETATRVVIRQARPAVLGGVILACGRAIGETMAVIYIIGTVAQIPHSLLDVGNTLSAWLLLQANGAIPGTLSTAALYELGLVLLVLSLLSSLIGRLLTKRLAGLAAIAGGGR